MHPLFERERELAALDGAASAALRGEGRMVVLEGPAGVGKTALIRSARRVAEDAGMRTLGARGGELERDFGFGVVGQLFERVVAQDDAQRWLSGPAALARPVLTPAGDGACADGGERTLPVLHGLLWLVVNLSEEQPLALLVDDAHWADAASLRFLAYLGQRLEGLPVLVVLSARDGVADAERIGPLLPVAETLPVPPLSRDATAELVRAVAPEAAEEVCLACHRATGGNAFYVLELAQAVADEGLATGAGSAERVLELSPGRASRYVGARLGALDGSARALAEAAAVLGERAPLRLAAALAGIERERSVAAADELCGAGILTPARPLEFRHPIVRTAVLDGLSAGARARRHALAADVLAAEDAPAERVALHLTHTDPAGDADVCARLLRAAREAGERGAPEAAVTYLRRALEEPPPRAALTPVLVELALAESQTFEVDAAAEHLRRAFAAATDREQRLQVAVLIAALAGHHAGAREATELLQRLRAEFADRPAVLDSIDAEIANAARFEMEARRLALPISDRLRAMAANGGLPAHPAVLAAVAAELAMAGAPREHVAAVALRGLEIVGEDARLLGGVVYLVLVRTLIVSDHLDEAQAALERWLEQSRRRGSALDHAFASVFRADLMYRRGDVFEAEADVRSAHAFAREHQWPMGRPVIVCHVLQVLAERGALGEGEALLREAELDGPAADQPGIYTSNLLLAARARLRAERDEHGAALEDLVECGRREEAWGERNPALIPWRSQAALSLRALGRLEEARDLAAEEVAVARRFGAPRALGIALRAAALVAPDDQAPAIAGEATAVLAHSAARLEHARALADLGRLLLADGGRRADARAVLREALELANRCGASVLEARVLAALREAGARPRRARLTGPKALTPSELRVARMAASGMPNREIAASLFVTVPAVEFHLRSTYRKLGIGGRRELEAALAREG